jgi:hypothetical protein
MALVIKDRVKETTTTTGTGTLTLAGATTGFQSFSTAIGNGNTTYYTISTPTGSQWEVGVGTVAAGTLARTTILASSNSGSAVNLSAGTKDVFGTYPAGKAVYQEELTRHSIRPSLLLDFANTKTLDPRITFTRASTATYYDGKTTAKAEENLLLRSQDYSATWTVTNLTPVTGKTAPDGTSTATEFTASAANAVLTQGFTAIAGSYTFSVYLRRVTGTGDIQIAADNGTWNTKVITASWARYDITQTATAGAKTAGIRVVDSGDAIEVWGAQLEQRSSVTAYNVTTTAPITNYIPTLLTAASGVPRFEHNPTTRESLGLEIEEQRTNLVLRSEEFDNAYWTKTNATITASTVVAPNGTLTGALLLNNSTNGEHRILRSIGQAPKTGSIYAKAGSASFIGVTLSGFGNRSAVFDLTLGVVSSVAGGTATIINVGNGWYRCSFYDSASNSSLLIINVGETAAQAVPQFSYVGTNKGIYIWGAQLEDAAFATSYIPTVASTVTRSADAASMTGSNFTSWFSNAQGTLYTEVNPKALAVSSGFQINDNTTSNRIRLATTSVSDQGIVTTSGNAQATLDGGTPAVDTNMKLAMSYAVNDFKLSLNGATAATDTAGTVPVVNQLQIGAETTTIGNMTLKKIAYYPLSLTASELQGLTTN